MLGDAWERERERDCGVRVGRHHWSTRRPSESLTLAMTALDAVGAAQQEQTLPLGHSATRSPYQNGAMGNERWTS